MKYRFNNNVNNNLKGFNEMSNLSRVELVQYAIIAILIACVAWLSVNDLKQERIVYQLVKETPVISANGLDCVSNCDDFELMVQSSESFKCLSCVNFHPQKTGQVQTSKQVQMTIGGRVLNTTDKSEF